MNPQSLISVNALWYEYRTVAEPADKAGREKDRLPVISARWLQYHNDTQSNSASETISGMVTTERIVLRQTVRAA